MSRKDFMKRIGTINRYMLLDRMRCDCLYWLGNGNRYDGHLWGKKPADHIQYMKWLWEDFGTEEKPEWLSMEEIEEFERQMCA